jgi:hypothetical protein
MLRSSENLVIVTIVSETSKLFAIKISVKESENAVSLSDKSSSASWALNSQKLYESQKKRNVKTFMKNQRIPNSIFFFFNILFYFEPNLKFF